MQEPWQFEEEAESTRGGDDHPNTLLLLRYYKMSLEELFASGSVPMLEDARYIPVLLIGSLSSLLSLLGSSCIMYMAYQEARTKLMQRLLFCLSLSDWISSMSLLVMPYLIPSFLGLAGAVGSFASCAGVGFFMLVASKMGCCYNAYLSMYYYLVVVRNWREADFSRRPHLELAGHVVAVVVTLAIEVAAVATQSINPTPVINNVCIYATWPWGCIDSPEVECTRSSDSTFKLLVTVSGPIYFLFSMAGFITAALVFAKVRSTLQKSSQYRFENRTSQTTTAVRTSNGAVSSTTTTSDPNNKRIQEVGMQAVLYTLAYFQSFFWPLMTVILSQTFKDSEMIHKKLEPGFYAFTILFFVFYPIQGFFNFFVYTRVKVKRWRTVEPDKSIFWIYKQIVAGIPPPATSTISRISTKYTKHTPSSEQLQQPQVQFSTTTIPHHQQQQPAMESSSVPSFQMEEDEEAKTSEQLQEEEPQQPTTPLEDGDGYDDEH
ncbi:expressed unknown protein [Seminavis robusta]|uniref:G-protein coupled receptors family 1 profile domain-containing protein n=1 Tax=Seminavis robusta TaxID=568900 RepID=A0A9N8DFW4_9STRA|nr:expressed unknown protein [Seminavis robusta]|eukprot:Sro138_g064640.1 n/a (490) ;mRNA; f:20633-22331